MKVLELNKVSCWILSEGFASLHNQALGIADRLGIEPVLKTVRARQPWRSLPPRLWLGPSGFARLVGDPLVPPWPELAIGCGGQGALAASLIRRASGGNVFTVQIQSPALPNRDFDVLVVPRHDNRVGDNVLLTEGAVHRVTAARLADEAARFRTSFATVPAPRVAVLIGGSNRRYRLTQRRIAELAQQLARLAKSGAGLLITASRRTEPDAIRQIRGALAGTTAYFWDGSGDNPYLAFLALADHILVTCDSVSMTSEAVSTGKPVHVLELDGRSRRIERFHARMRQAGFTRRFQGQLDSWSYTPPDDTGRVAERIALLLKARIEGARAPLRHGREGADLA